MIEVRITLPTDAWTIRELRLEALLKEGHYLTASYPEEAARPFSAWKAACTETTDHAVFAAFENGHAVAMVQANRFDANSVKWGASYTKEAYRGSGASGRLSILREQWSKARGFERAVFTIRDNNEKSTTIQVKHGAVKIGEEPMRFANDEVATAVWYEQRLI